MVSTDFISRQQENLVDNQKCQAGFRPLCNKILLFHEEHVVLLFLHWSNRWQHKYRSLAIIISSFFFQPIFWTRFIFIIHRKHVLYGMPYLLTYSNMHARMNITSLDWFIIMQSYSNEALSIIVTSAVELKLARLLQLNKCETDPYFLQNFQCTTMFMSAFCQTCELNTEHEIVFVLISVDS